MNYSKIYSDFIADRRLKESAISGYSEKHHIVPRSLGGGNEKNNIIRLSAGDHYFSHLLLAKIHGKGMWFAFISFNKSISGRKNLCINKRLLYEIAKKRHSEYMKDFQSTPEMKVILSARSKKLHSNPEIKKRHREAVKLAHARPDVIEKRKIIMSKVHSDPERNKKIGDSKRGRIVSEETKNKIREKRKLQKMSVDHIAALQKGARNCYRSKEGRMRTMEALIKAKSIKVRCVETGDTFLSMKDASKWVGTAVKEAFRKRNKYNKAGGYHWEIC